jgi:hypothetical protein
MTNLVISGTAQAYISNCTVDTQVTKSSSGYVEIINSELQCISGIQISGAGITIINGNKNVAVSVSNASAQVIIKGCNSVVTPSASAGNLAIVDCIVTALGGNGITITGASTTLTLLNSQVLVQAGNNVAPISVAGIYSIINTIYDKPGSTVTGTSTNSVDYFQYIDADNINTKGLTVTGSINVSGSVINSLTASYATNALSASFAPSTPAFPFTGSAGITGSLTVVGTTQTTQLGIGAAPSGSTRLDVRAQGALSTDIAFRVRNSADTKNSFEINGLGQGIIRSTSFVPRFSVSYVSDTGVDRDAFIFTQNVQNAMGRAWTFDAGYNGAFEGLRIFNDLAGNDQGIFTIQSNNYCFGTSILNAEGSITERRVLRIANGVAPSNSKTDEFKFYSSDITAGNAAPHFRTENGSIIKLYQQSAVTSSQGLADVLTNLGLLTGSSTIASTPPFPFTGSALITGSLGVTGSASILAYTSSAVKIFSVRNSANTYDIISNYGSELTIIGRNESTEPRLLVDRLGSTRMLLGGTTDLNITFPSSGFGQINTGTQGLDIIASSGDIRTRNSSTSTILKGNFFGVGQATPAARLDILAQGALSTDIAFRVRNSADSNNILTVLGSQDVFIGTTTTPAGQGHLFNIRNGGSTSIPFAYFDNNSFNLDIDRFCNIKFGFGLIGVTGATHTLLLDTGSVPSGRNYGQTMAAWTAISQGTNDSGFVQTGGDTSGNNAVYYNYIGKNWTLGGITQGNGKNVLALITGSAPTNNISSSFQLYASTGSLTNNTRPHIRTGNGTVVWLGDESRLFNVTASNITASSVVSSFTGSLTGSVTNYETAWTPYTPIWTAASVDPVIGNGTIEGWYKVIGKTCFVRGNIVMGSTTTFGSGEWYVSMPFTASNADSILMTANLLDNGSAWYNAVLNGARAGFNYKTPIQYQAVGGTANDVNATQPFTWANSDRFLWNGTYELI